MTFPQTNRLESITTELATRAMSLNQRLAQRSVPNESALATYRFWQVEPLLLSASELMDRCLQLSDRHLALCEAMFRRALELEDDAHRVDELEYRALEPRVKSPGDTDRKDFPAPSAEQYFYAGAENNLLQSTALEQLYGEARGNYAKYLSSGSGKSEDRAPSVSTQSIAEQRWIIEKQLASLRQRRESNYGAEVLSVPRELAYVKNQFAQKSSLLGAGMPLDLQLQLEHLERHIDQAFDDALERVGAAVYGLRRIFFLDIPDIEVTRDSLHETLKAASALSVLIKGWLSQLSKFSALDQTFSTSVSLRQLFGAEWTDLLALRKLEFRLTKRLFEGHQYVRLRGVSAVVIPKSTDANAYTCISLRVRPPKHGLVGIPGQFNRRLTDWRFIDQRTVPECTLGRVMSLRADQQPETAGGVSLLNASPICDEDGPNSMWNIRINRSIIGDASQIEDLLLTVHCTGRPIEPEDTWS